MANTIIHVVTISLAANVSYESHTQDQEMAGFICQSEDEIDGYQRENYGVAILFSYKHKKYDTSYNANDTVSNVTGEFS